MHQALDSTGFRSFHSIVGLESLTSYTAATTLLLSRTLFARKILVLATAFPGGHTTQCGAVPRMDHNSGEGCTS